MWAIIVPIIMSSVAPRLTTGKYIIILENEVEIVNIDGGGVPVVFATYMGMGANNDFLALPLWVQEALIAHELGHIWYGHFYKEYLIERSLYVLIWGTADPNERDADLYGAEIVGFEIMIDMLKYANDLCMSLGAIECVAETKLRVELLRNLWCI